MLFSSIPFLYYFLPFSLILYFISPKKLKNTALLLSSLFFYGWGEPRLLILMLISVVQGYVLGLLIEKFESKGLKKALLCLSLTISLGLLCVFKYLDFFIESINHMTNFGLPLLRLALPIGISFYTFQILSYTVDVYRGRVRAQRNFIDLAAYITMFPQLIAGPIVRYSDIEKALKSRSTSIESLSLGARRFIFGLSKKILIANVLGELIADFKASDDKSVLYFWLYAIAFTLHIYFDFSGYSDMAIGLGRIYGFDFLENFNYPYISKSITEFWRRWHISLGSWFRDYLYIPLGGNRVGPARHLFNILLVWLATGLWHGAAWTFVLWGLLYAVLLIFEKFILKDRLKEHRIISHIYTMFFVILGFVLFDSDTVGSALECIKAMLLLGAQPLVSPSALYSLRGYFVVLIIAIIGSTPLVSSIIKRLSSRSVRLERAREASELIVLPLLLLLCTAFLADGSFNPFLYFRF